MMDTQSIVIDQASLSKKIIDLLNGCSVREASYILRLADDAIRDSVVNIKVDSKTINWYHPSPVAGKELPTDE